MIAKILLKWTKFCYIGSIFAIMY